MTAPGESVRGLVGGEEGCGACTELRPRASDLVRRESWGVQAGSGSRSEHGSALGL